MPDPFNLADIIAGPARILINGSVIGHTEGGIRGTYTPDYRRREVDRFGTSPAEQVLQGEELTVTFTVAQTVFDNMRFLAPAADVSVTTGNYFYIGRQPGFLASRRAVHLRIHPETLADGNFSRDLVLFRAVCVSAVEIPYVVDGDTAVECTFTALVVEGNANARLLGAFGTGP